jgi:hypothetical protein
MAVRNRTKCFVGTNIEMTVQEKVVALSLAQMLFQKGFLPVAPFVLREYCDVAEEEYRHLRLTMLGECQSAVWLGSPTEPEANMCVQLGIVSRSIE